MFSAKAIAASIVNIAVAALLVAACGSSSEELTSYEIVHGKGAESSSVVPGVSNEMVVWVQAGHLDAVQATLNSITSAASLSDPREACIAIGDAVLVDDFQTARKLVPDTVLHDSLQLMSDNAIAASLYCALGEADPALEALELMSDGLSTYNDRVEEMTADLEAAK